MAEERDGSLTIRGRMRIEALFVALRSAGQRNRLITQEPRAYEQCGSQDDDVTREKEVMGSYGRLGFYFRW